MHHHFLVGLFLALLAHAENEKNTFQGQKLSWKEDDGLEIKIVRPISEEKCTMKSQAGDIVDQYYKLVDEDGKEIGSNFGKTPYVFELGAGKVIPGMDRKHSQTLFEFKLQFRSDDGNGKNSELLVCIVV